MIITYSSGKREGIIEYLETGQHRDRDYTRQELDHRIELFGDKDETRYIINHVNPKTPPKKKANGYGERYKHFTLSFKEDFLPEEWYKKIALEFKNFILAEHNENEANIYAEAHLPKIKNYMSKNGHLISRKPHIHIVIPTLNLLSGTKTLSFSFNRFGFKNYLLAFQEYINSKYGLESPLDLINRNLLIDHAQRMFEKGASFLESDNRGLKVKIMIDIIEKGLRNQSDLRQYISQNYPEVEEIDSHYSNKYLFLKFKTDKNGQKYGVALKDFVFSDDFMSLSKSLKITLAEDFFSRRTLTISNISLPKSPKALCTTHKKQLNLWQSLGKYEVKYGRMVGRNWEKYAELSPAEQRNALIEIKDIFYQRCKDPYYTFTQYDLYKKRVKSAVPKPAINPTFVSSIEKINDYSKELFLNILEKRYGINVNNYLDKTTDGTIFSFKTQKNLSFLNFLKEEMSLDESDLATLTESVNDYKISTMPSLRFNALNALMREYSYDSKDGTADFKPKIKDQYDLEMHNLINKFREFVSAGKREQKKEISPDHLEVAKQQAELYKENTKDILQQRYSEYLKEIQATLSGRSKLIKKVTDELDRWLGATIKECEKQAKLVEKTTIRDLINYSTGFGYNKLAVDNRFKYYIMDNANQYPTLYRDMLQFIKNTIPLDKDLAYKVLRNHKLSKELGINYLEPVKPNYDQLMKQGGVVDFNQYLKGQNR